MKKIVFLLIAILIASCKSEVKAPIVNIPTPKTQVLTVKYELSEMSLEAHAQLGSDVVGNFSSGKINGLISKTFIGNLEKGVFGGVYYFIDQARLDAYLTSELWKSIVAHPNLINFKIERYAIADISKISNGFADVRKTATETSSNTANQLLIVNYELLEMSLEAHAKLGSDVVGNFAPGKINGLIGKTFIGNLEKKVFGGVYYFTDQASLDTYLTSELWKGIASHPNLVNFKNERYSISPISSISNGLPSL
jgi:hypothetical protein